MKSLCNFLTVIFLSLTLAACASDPMKAPCNAQASFCGVKTKINQ